MRKHHNVVHSGKERPLDCLFCASRWNNQIKLDEHTLRHIKEKPIACDYCDMAFVTPIELRMHMQSVHPSSYNYGSRKLIECVMCAKSFSSIMRLQQHIPAKFAPSLLKLMLFVGNIFKVYITEGNGTGATSVENVLQRGPNFEFTFNAIWEKRWSVAIFMRGNLVVQQAWGYIFDKSMKKSATRVYFVRSDFTAFIALLNTIFAMFEKSRISARFAGKSSEPRPRGNIMFVFMWCCELLEHFYLLSSDFFLEL